MKGDRRVSFGDEIVRGTLKYRYVKLSRNYETWRIYVTYHCVIYPSTAVRSIKCSARKIIKVFITT